MNRGVFLAPFAATLTLLLNRVACQPQCDLNGCADQCTSLGAVRWSCEEEGCLCTFPLEDAKALCKGGGGGGAGGGSGGSDGGSGGAGVTGDGDNSGGEGGGSDRDKQKKKGQDDEDYDGGSIDTGTSSEEGGNNKHTKTPGGSKKSKGTTKSPADSGKKPPGHGGKPPGAGQDTSKEGGSGDKAEQPPDGTQSSKGSSMPTTSADDYGQKDYGQKDYGVKARGAHDELMPRKALEPDRGASSDDKGGKMHMPFVVRSLHRPLSPKQVMEQLKRQKGDIPMKEIQEFLKKGGR